MRTERDRARRWTTQRAESSCPSGDRPFCTLNLYFSRAAKQACAQCDGRRALDQRYYGSSSIECRKRREDERRSSSSERTVDGANQDGGLTTGDTSKAPMGSNHGRGSGNIWVKCESKTASTRGKASKVPKLQRDHDLMVALHNRPRRRPATPNRLPFGAGSMIVFVSGRTIGRTCLVYAGRGLRCRMQLTNGRAAAGTRRQQQPRSRNLGRAYGTGLDVG